MHLSAPVLFNTAPRESMSSRRGSCKNHLISFPFFALGEGLYYFPLTFLYPSSTGSLCSHLGRIMQIPMKCHGPRTAWSFFWMQTDHTAITGLWLLGTLWTCSFLFLLFQTHRLPGLWQSHSPENALPVDNNKTISYVICTTSGISCQGQKCEMGLTFWMTSL